MGLRRPIASIVAPMTATIAVAGDICSKKSIMEGTQNHPEAKTSAKSGNGRGASSRNGLKGSSNKSCAYRACGPAWHIEHRLNKQGGESWRVRFRQAAKKETGNHRID